MTVVGYARTSTADQVAGLEDQVKQLEAAGCERIWQEHVSASSTDRPELLACLTWMREGDVFIVTRPDRLARSVRDMLGLIDDLKERGVSVRILSMGLDMSTATGKLILTVLAGVAEMEREIMLERQRAGIAKALSEGKYKGRPRKLTEEKLAEARKMLDDGVGPSEVSRRFGVERATLWRALRS